MAQQVRVRPQTQTIPWTANGLQSIPLGRGMVYREMYIRLQGQLTCTAGNNVAANMFPGDEWAVVKNIVIRQNGSDEIKRINGAALRWLMFYLYGLFPIKQIATLGDGATANPAFDTTLVIPFWMPRSLKPMDCVLDSRILADLNIDIQWGTFTDINANATGFTVAPTVNVFSLESFNINGPFSRWNIFPLTDIPGAANVQENVRLPVGPMYRAFLIQDTANTPIITNLKLYSGTTIFADVAKPVMRTALALDRRGVDFNSIIANTNFLAGAPNDDSNHFLYYDHVTDGYNTEAIDTYGLSEFFLQFNVNAAGTINIWPMQIYPLRGQAGQAAVSGRRGATSRAV